MLQNAYLLAKIGADTAENERNFAQNLPKTSGAAGRRPGRRGRAALRSDAAAPGGFLRPVGPAANRSGAAAAKGA